MSDIAEKLRMLRAAEDMTLREIAEHLDIPQRTWVSYERGERKQVPYQALRKIGLSPIFGKYLLWLITDRTDSGPQVQP